MKSKETFKVIVLGCSGGPAESNLSGYLIASKGSHDYIAFDAGTLLSGIEIALHKNPIENPIIDSSLTPHGNFFLHHVKAYLISHAHIDHIAGLVVNSQVDLPKTILGIDFTIDNLRDHIFNGKIWPNYGNEGAKALNQYRYIRLQEGLSTPIPNTLFTVEPFFLSHPHEYLSTAFLIEWSGNYIIYFGDTSSDALEKSKRIEVIWKRIAPLIKMKALKGIFLECSYPLKDSERIVYGHLDPKTMLEELARLDTTVSLKGMPIIVTHRKDSLLKGEDQKELIAKELAHSDPLGLKWIFPAQGDLISL